MFAGTVRALGAVWPEAAAKVMLTVFCTPRRMSATAWDRGLQPERQWLDVEGQRIAVYAWGPSLNGKKVLLAHGWSGRSEQLRALVEPLRERGFAVYAFDQPGHGNSSGKIANIPRFARTLEAVARHLGGIDALVAHSLGASAAAYAVSQGMPAAKLVMVAPPAQPRRFIVGFWRMLGIADALGERMNRILERQEKFRLADLDLPALAPKISSEVLVVHDRGDREVPHAEGVQWSQALGDARLLSTEKLGHNRLLAAPEVTEAITRFVLGTYEPRRADAA